jgi:hypothetical protein
MTQNRVIWLVMVVALLAFCLGAVRPVPSQKLTPETQKVKEKVDQHWRIVPDVAPVDLQRQLKILNEGGIVVNRNDIILVGDKFTIMISDAEEEEEE